jgi:lysophospholipase L1-like esterase
MNILLVGDSHCYDMGDIMKGSSKQIKVLSIIKGDKIHVIKDEYIKRLATIRNFRPDKIIIHCGHNDMSYHPRYNLIPRISRDVTIDSVNFATRVQHDNPLAKVFLSSILPRKHTYSSCLSEEQTLTYNKLAVRHGLRLKKKAAEVDLEVLLNTFMFKRVYKFEEKKELIWDDGLHLNAEGKGVLANGWMINIRQGGVTKNDS